MRTWSYALLHHARCGNLMVFTVEKIVIFGIDPDMAFLYTPYAALS